MKPKSFTIPCLGYELGVDIYNGGKSHVILAATGWKADRVTYEPLLGSLVEKTGYSAVVFDYSGFGTSQIKIDDTRPAQHFIELLTVFEWVELNFPEAKIDVLGTSYGGFLAMQLAEYRNFHSLVLRVPAIYKPEDFYTLQPQIDHDLKDAAYRSDAEYLAQHPLFTRRRLFDGASLVIVHENDEWVPVPTTDAFITALGADSYLAKGFPHGLGEMPEAEREAYKQHIANWLLKNA